MSIYARFSENRHMHYPTCIAALVHRNVKQLRTGQEVVQTNKATLHSIPHVESKYLMNRIHYDIITPILSNTLPKHMAARRSRFSGGLDGGEVVADCAVVDRADVEYSGQPAEDGDWLPDEAAGVGQDGASRRESRLRVKASSEKARGLSRCSNSMRSGGNRVTLSTVRYDGICRIWCETLRF